MEYRKLGRTGLEVSVVGFGCGNVGGLMIRGEHGDQVRAAARAMELGINYFDTASSYGNGQSEQNLGRVLNELSADVYVGTKVRLGPEDMDLGQGEVTHPHAEEDDTEKSPHSSTKGGPLCQRRGIQEHMPRNDLP